MPRAGRPENSDGRCAERRRDMDKAGIVGYGRCCRRQRQNGLAQIGSGQIASLGIRRRSPAPAVFPPGRPRPRRRTRRREGGEPERHTRRPASVWPDRRRPGRVRPPGAPPVAVLPSPSGDLGRRDLEFRYRPLGRYLGCPPEAPATRTRRPCAAACPGRSGASLRRTKRASPNSPIRSGIPARKGASADFQVFGMIRAVP